MNTSTLQQLENKDNEHVAAQSALYYLLALTELSKRIPDKGINLYKSADYQDRKWLQQMFALSRDGQGWFNRVKLKAAYLVVLCAPKFLRRLCLMDDIISIISAEEPFCRSRATYDRCVMQTQELYQCAQLKLSGEELAEAISLIEQHEENLKRFLNFFSRACTESKQLKSRYLRFFSSDDNIVNELSVEYCYDAIMEDKADDLKNAVLLRDAIPYECRQRHTADYDNIDQTMVRLRRESLELYGVGSVLDALGRMLRGEQAGTA